MNLKFVLVSSLEVIEKRFYAKPRLGLGEIPKSYNNGGGDQSNLITDPNSIQVFKHGLTPHFAQEPMNIMTARAEGNKNKDDNPGYSGSKAIFLQPEFRNPIFFKRCIVVADAYFTRWDKNLPYLVYIQRKKPIWVCRNLRYLATSREDGGDYFVCNNYNYSQRDASVGRSKAYASDPSSSL